MRMECKAMRLVGAHELRGLLGVSRQRVYQLAARSDFPKPVATLAQGKVWSIDDIEKWVVDRRRPRAEIVPAVEVVSVAAIDPAAEVVPELVGVPGG